MRGSRYGVILLFPCARRLLRSFFACGLTAQTKLPPAPADYGQWETLVESGGGGGRGGRGGVGSGGLSPDGKWLAYGINRTNGKNELHVVPVAGARPRSRRSARKRRSPPIRSGSP